VVMRMEPAILSSSLRGTLPVEIQTLRLILGPWLALSCILSAWVMRLLTQSREPALGLYQQVAHVLRLHFPLTLPFVFPGVGVRAGKVNFAIMKYLADGTPDPSFGPSNDGIALPNLKNTVSAARVIKVCPFPFLLVSDLTSCRSRKMVV